MPRGERVIARCCRLRSAPPFGAAPARSIQEDCEYSEYVTGNGTWKRRYATGGRWPMMSPEA
eukprot:773589-Prymnesium_polylepis.1